MTYQKGFVYFKISPKSPMILGCLLSTVFLLFGATVNVRIFSRRSKLLAAKKNTIATSASNCEVFPSFKLQVDFFTANECGYWLVVSKICYFHPYLGK